MADPAPLCVDLDGTLVRTDLLAESFLALIHTKPWCLLMIPIWLLRGKAALKAEIASRVEIDPSLLPYRVDLLDCIRRAREEGRTLVLATSANEKLANAVAHHLGIFGAVYASDESENLAGSRKAARLVEAYGARGFDYCGNAPVDVAVWRAARKAIVVGGGERLARRAAQVSTVQATFPDAPVRPEVLARACRLHQWVKNLLLFTPLLAAHRAADGQSDLSTLLAFLAFSLCASSVYLLNDLFDLEADRRHPRKSQRPFASGALSPVHGLLLAPALLAAAVALALVLPPRFLAVLSAYYCLTLGYSVLLKRLVLIDVVTLASLYTLRIVAGAQAVDVPLSFWLLVFSIFLFLSLALVKRYAELDGLRAQGRLAAAGRGYLVQDLQVLQSFGVASGYLSALVLALYINSPEISVLYQHPTMVWGLCVILLYWISRIWIKTHRGQMHDDPLVFAITDRQSQVLGLASAALLFLAL